MKLTVILAPERGGRYSVICPAVSGCVSQGDSLEEALANIREAILLCLEVRRADGLPSPVETPEIIIAREIRECLEDRAVEGLPLTIETREVNLEVEVAPCGAALCGTVTKVLANRSMSRDGAPMEAVDSRPALGMTLLKDFVPVQAGEGNAQPSQWTGEIYNRENGQTYRCQMSLHTAPNGATELVLHAYVGIPLFGKTQHWQRVASSAAAATATTTATQH